MKKDFELLPHTADLKIRAYGVTLQELFRNALYGMFQAVGPKAKVCEKKGERLYCKELTRHHAIEVQAPDYNALLVDFLSAALSQSDIYNEAYFDAVFYEFDQQHVKATVYGVPIEGFEIVEIKAVTHHDIAIKHIDGIWQTEIVFDI